MTEVNNTPELDLSDEDTVRRLLEADVLKKPAVDTETVEIQDKIKKLQQKTTFSFKLNGVQLDDLKRKGAAKGVSWQDYLNEQIQLLIFEAPVGKPVINRPGFVSGGRVSGQVGGLVSRG
jgi:predicted DNA binding CopG/RHH family protein